LEDVKVVSRKGYFPYFTGIDYISTPFADYSKFVEYVKLNKIEFVFLEHQTLRDFPFMERFLNNDTPEFIRLASKLDFTGHKLELYKLRKN
jgi:hypothetical protein